MGVFPCMESTVNTSPEANAPIADQDRHLPSAKRLTQLGMIYALALTFISYLMIDMMPGGWVFALLLWILVLVGGSSFIVVQRMAKSSGQDRVVQRNLSRLHLGVSIAIATAVLLMVTSALFDAANTGAAGYVAVLVVVVLVASATCVGYLLNELRVRER